MPFLRRLPLRVLLFAVTRPWTTLAIAGVVCAACAVTAYLRLPISTDQNKLFSRDVPFFRAYLDFVDKFPENEQAYALIEPADPAAPPPPAARWTALADAMAARLRAMPTVVKHVTARVPPEALGDQGLLFEDPAAVPARTAEATRSLWMMQRVAEPPSAHDRLLGLGEQPLERMFNGMSFGIRWVPGSANPAAEAAPFAGAVAASLDRALADRAAPLVPGRGLPDLNALGAESPRDLGYYYLPDQSDPARRVMLVSIEPAQDTSSLTGLSESVDAIRGAIRAEAAAFPEFRVSLTGRPALEADEMSTTDVDQRKAETVAMTAIFLGLLAFLRSLRLALSAVVCLGVAVGLTFGWAMLGVGELNLLSLVFLIALIGIGMDYFVQLLSRYRVERARRGSRGAVWVAVYRQVAVAVTTTCLGAAGAFLTSLFTNFQGAADLGKIAGGGLLLCLACGFTVLPALLTVTERWWFRRTAVPRGRRPRAAAVGGDVFGVSPPARRRSMWLLVGPAAWVLVLVALVPAALRTRFDPGLLNLQAPDLESVRTVRKLQTWSAVVLSKDLGVLRRARAAVEASPEVASTESALTAFDNAEWLGRNATAIRQIKWTEPPALKPADVERLPAVLRKLAELMRSA
ncbi:MAG TPA: MMPL family transporter, partial [Humisphaera sp.]